MRDLRKLDHSYAEMDEDFAALGTDPLDFLDGEEDGLSSHDPLDMPEMFWPHPDEASPAASPRSKSTKARKADADPNWQQLSAILDSLYESDAGDSLSD